MGIKSSIYNKPKLTGCALRGFNVSARQTEQRHAAAGDSDIQRLRAPAGG